MTILAMAKLFWVAIDLGKISPKIRMTAVITPVAMPTAWLATRSMVTAVARAEAAILTMLLPIRIVERSLWESSFIFFISLSVLPPFLARYLALTLLMENKAVSAEEKNPDKNTRAIKTKYSDDI